MMRKAIIGLLLLLLPLLTTCGLIGSAPNLVLICIDAVRADQFFHPDIKDELSPWLNSAQSYQQAMTVSPWTLPTVATVFTGLYPIQHGAGQLPGEIHNLAKKTPTALSETAETLAELLSRERYSTGIFTTHPWLRENFGLDQGFATKGFSTKTQTLSEEMLQWITDLRSRDLPFFAYLHLMETHHLHRKPEAEVRARLTGLDSRKQAFLAANRMPSVCRKKTSTRCIRSQAYQASVLEARENLAAVLKSLSELGKLDNTVVVLYSDHGEAFRERSDLHRELQKDPRNMYGTGHGQYQFQELLHVPLLAWLPGVDGQAHSQRVSLVDLFPSILHWLGIASPDTEQTGQLLPGPGAQSTGERVIYASNIAYGPETLAILAGQNKAMYWPQENRFRFFDLEQDPGEQQPIESDALLLKFSTLAGDYLALPPYYSSSAPQPGQNQLEDLQAIGYLQGVDEPQDAPQQHPDAANETFD